MGPFRSEPVMCRKYQKCSEWAWKYMGYCLCSKRDGLSLGLGVISVISWVVAEIPQVITNYKKKSADGLSVLFLLTWIIGDMFNLLGCVLEPATLPTQYYTAVLYTMTTLCIASQSVYYGHIYPRLKFNKRNNRYNALSAGDEDRDKEDDTENVSSTDRCGVKPTSPIRLRMSSRNSSPEDLYFMSARSLSLSHTPPIGSFSHLKALKSDAEQNVLKEPLIDRNRSPSSPKIKTFLCLFPSIMFFVACYNNRHLHESFGHNIVLETHTRGRRKALGNMVSESNGIGSFLGWGMAVIYMGGRVAQIFRNFRRGSAEGLNPLMFVFALVGNLTYMASILVNSLEWSKIQPNLAWLVDAGGCVLLDTFIVLQFIYFRHRTKGESGKLRSFVASDSNSAFTRRLVTEVC